MAMPRHEQRWKALGLIGVAYLMVVLDVSIVNVALPKISEALGFSARNLQWVVTAYALTLGGFLLLAGRCADLLGRRRLFIVGLALFSVASLLCGLATSQVMLIGARAIQGVGGAILTSSAFALVGVTFEEGTERNKALGILGAISGFGAGLGVVLGGVFADYLGWEWIFFVNVPIGLVALVMAPAVIRESRAEAIAKHFDALGASAITAGLLLLVYTLTHAPSIGWSAPTTVGLLAVSTGLLVGFLAIEHRSRAPLVRLAIFRSRTLAGANLVAFGLGGTIISAFFLLSLYMQQVLGLSALEAGVGYLVVTGTTIAASGGAHVLVAKVGLRAVLAGGVALLAGSILLFAQISAQGSFATELLPGFFVLGAGVGLGSVPVSIAALSGITQGDSGLASGLFTTSQEIGAAMGVAVVTTVAAVQTTAALGAGAAYVLALTDGYKTGFIVAAGIAVVTLVATIAIPRRGELRATHANPP